jgi:hypothetical protein
MPINVIKSHFKQLISGFHLTKWPLREYIFEYLFSSPICLSCKIMNFKKQKHLKLSVDIALFSETYFELTLLCKKLKLKWSKLRNKNFLFFGFRDDKDKRTHLTFCWPCIIMYHNNVTNFTFTITLLCLNSLHVSGVKRPSSGGTTLAVFGVSCLHINQQTATIARISHQKLLV